MNSTELLWTANIYTLPKNKIFCYNWLNTFYGTRNLSLKFSNSKNWLPCWIRLEDDDNRNNAWSLVFWNFRTLTLEKAISKERGSHSSMASTGCYTRKNTKLYKHWNSQATHYKDMIIRTERTEFLITLMTQN